MGRIGLIRPIVREATLRAPDWSDDRETYTRAEWLCGSLPAWPRRCWERIAGGCDRRAETRCSARAPSADAPSETDAAHREARCEFEWASPAHTARAFHNCCEIVLETLRSGPSSHRLAGPLARWRLEIRR